ncbi:hypothetical protein D3C72_2319140 [compost metagenome]
MQHKATVGLHGATAKDQIVLQILAAQGQIDFVQQRLQTQRGGLVNDQPKRSALVVLTQIHHAAGKGLIFQTGHGDQEMVRQVDGHRFSGHNGVF